MAIVEVSIVPIGTETTSLSNYVAGALKVLQDEKDVKYEITAMGTILEGELDTLLAVIQKMHQSAFDGGARRVVTTIKIDDRRDKRTSISYKLASVKRKLAQPS